MSLVKLWIHRVILNKWSAVKFTRSIGKVLSKIPIGDGINILTLYWGQMKGKMEKSRLEARSFGIAPAVVCGLIELKAIIPWGLGKWVKTVKDLGFWERKFTFICTFLIPFSWTSSDCRRKRTYELTKVKNCALALLLSFQSLTRFLVQTKEIFLRWF